MIRIELETENMFTKDYALHGNNYYKKFTKPWPKFFSLLLRQVLFFYQKSMTKVQAWNMTVPPNPKQKSK